MTSIMNEGRLPGPHKDLEENKGYYGNKPYTKEIWKLGWKGTNLFLRGTALKYCEERSVK